MGKKKIAPLSLVHEWLVTWGGSEEVFLEFLQFPHTDAFCLFTRPNAQTAPLAKAALQTTFFQHISLFRRHYPFFLWLMPYAYSKLSPQGELLLTNCHAFSKCTPKRFAHLCYCYTPIRYLWVMPRAYMETLPLAVRPLARAMVRVLRAIDLKAAAQVDQFVAISETVRRRIARHYQRESQVIYPPVDTDFFCPDARVEREDFYLFVGRLVPYKRVDLAIRACREGKKKLLVVGSGPEKRRLHRENGGVQWLPFQPRPKLRSLLRRASALIFCANEDFGLLPREAKACGTPVIALRRGGVLEKALEGTGTFFQEASAASLLEAMEALEKRGFSPQACREEALQFAPHFFRQKWQDLLAFYLA